MINSKDDYISSIIKWWKNNSNRDFGLNLLFWFGFNQLRYIICGVKKQNSQLHCLFRKIDRTAVSILHILWFVLNVKQSKPQTLLCLTCACCCACLWIMASKTFRTVCSARDVGVLSFTTRFAHGLTYSILELSLFTLLALRLTSFVGVAPCATRRALGVSCTLGKIPYCTQCALCCTTATVGTLLTCQTRGSIFLVLTSTTSYKQK